MRIYWPTVELDTLTLVVTCFGLELDKIIKLANLKLARTPVLSMTDLEKGGKKGEKRRGKMRTLGQNAPQKHSFLHKKVKIFSLASLAKAQHALTP